jgi:hypothetical protein
MGGNPEIVRCLGAGICRWKCSHRGPHKRRNSCDLVCRNAFAGLPFRCTVVPVKLRADRPNVSDPKLAYIHGEAENEKSTC